MDAIKFFKHPSTPGQRQYEALRAYYLDDVPGHEVARRYGYTYAAFNSLKQKLKSGVINFFVTQPKGSKSSRISEEIRNKIISYRNKRLSAHQISEVLDTFGEIVSVSTIARILDEEGFPKLPRRTQLKIGLTKDNTITPEYSKVLDMKKINDLEIECAIGGIFLFVPLIEHCKLPSIIKKPNYQIRQKFQHLAMLWQC